MEGVSNLYVELIAIGLDILAIHINTKVIPKFCPFHGVVSAYN